MATRITRSPISADLIKSIARSLLNLESSVIVAPMQAGKTYLARNIRENVRETARVVHFEFAARAAITSEGDVFKDLRESPPGCEHVDDVSSFFAALTNGTEVGDKPLVLIISHLDALSRELARRFLIEIRAAVNAPDSNVAALITAESHVFDLLLGPHSEFNCANEYILQGFDLPLFTALLDKLSDEFELRLDADPELAASLWKLTGGSVYLLRQCLLAWIDYRFARSDIAPELLDLAMAHMIADRLSSPGARECVSFRRIIDIIDANPGSLSVADALITKDRAPADPEPPHAFELSGLAHYRHGF